VALAPTFPLPARTVAAINRSATPGVRSSCISTAATTASTPSVRCRMRATPNIACAALPKPRLVKIARALAFILVFATRQALESGQLAIVQSVVSYPHPNRSSLQEPCHCIRLDSIRRAGDWSGFGRALDNMRMPLASSSSMRLWGAPPNGGSVPLLRFTGLRSFQAL